MRPAARVGDRVICLCKCKKKICPPGIILMGSQDTILEGRPIARLGDLTSNCCGSCCRCPNQIIQASATTYVNGRGMARIMDRATCGLIVQGSATTYAA